MIIRTGQGFDAHRLAGDRPLVIGGVAIPWEQGLLGHSDADVLTHAVMDALLGAAGLGDIGVHFPPSETRWKDACSLDLLAHVADLLKAGGWTVVNVDATIIAEAPKMRPHIPGMQANLSGRIHGRPPVSVKATTTEGMGFAGRGEGMAAMAVALLRRDQEEASC